MDDRNSNNSANQRKWDSRAGTYDDRRYDYFRFMQRKLISIADVRAPCNFLDLGCGTGWAVSYVAKLMNGKGHFIGIDLAEKMVEMSRAKANGFQNVYFYVASSDDLPLESSYFDRAICTNSFHHYSNPGRVAREIGRVLKPRGRVYILDVTADDFFTRWVDKKVRAKEKEHVKFYRTREYVEIFSQAGLRHTSSHRLDIYYPLKVHVAEKE